MDKLIVTISGVVSIIAIYWFFFGKKETTVDVNKSVTITVEGGYKPKSIHVAVKKKTILVFIRKDANPCLEELVIPDLKIKRYLPMHTPVTLTISPAKPGKYDVHCGMNMFHATINVS